VSRASRLTSSRCHGPGSKPGRLAYVSKAFRLTLFERTQRLCRRNTVLALRLKNDKPRRSPSVENRKIASECSFQASPLSVSRIAPLTILYAPDVTESGRASLEDFLAIGRHVCEAVAACFGFSVIWLQAYFLHEMIRFLNSVSQMKIRSQCSDPRGHGRRNY
jgi:hypothetical protein